MWGQAFLAKAGAAAVCSGRAQVTYFESSAVKSAFDKGALLFDSSDKHMVHASRHEKPGMAKVHNKDADIIYVLDGTATIITGASPWTQRRSRRTRSAQRNQRRRDAAASQGRCDDRSGRHSAHWFKEVSTPFLYYVVNGNVVTFLSARRVTPDISMDGDPNTGVLYGQTYRHQRRCAG